MPLDREKLTKVLAMTTSPVSHEALAAIRTANAMLTRENMTWEDVLTVAPTNMRISITRGPIDEDWVAPHLKDKVVIDLMFRCVFSAPHSNNDPFWKFMDSIHQRWLQHGNLSQGQYSALKRSYQRATTTTPAV